MPLSEAEELELLELEESEHQAKSNSKKPSTAYSGLRGAAQGLLMNFADEGAGAMGLAGEAVLGGIRKLRTGDSGLDDFGDIYRDHRDAYRKEDEELRKENPKSFVGGEVGGGIASSFIPVLGAGKAATSGARALQAAKLGLIGGSGSSESDLTKGEVGGVAKDAAISGLLSGGLTRGVEGLGQLPGALRGKAEKLAVAATGATRNQAEKFAPNAGRELLDRGLVQAFDSPASIAERAKKLMAEQGKKISNALSAADTKGVKVSPERVLQKVRESIEKLKQKGAGHADQVRAMEKMAEDLSESIGKNPVSLSVLESQKRSFGKNTNWADPDKALAKKGIYRTLRDTSEDELSTALPETADSFKEGKKVWGLVDPIQEAAERRALQLENHPKGGLLDLGAGAAGIGLAGFAGEEDKTNLGVAALLALIARRAGGPRINSTLAKGADISSKVLKPLGLLETEAVKNNAKRVIPALINAK